MMMIVMMTTMMNPGCLTNMTVVLSVNNETWRRVALWSFTLETEEALGKHCSVIHTTTNIKNECSLRQGDSSDLGWIMKTGRKEEDNSHLLDVGSAQVEDGGNMMRTRTGMRTRIRRRTRTGSMMGTRIRTRKKGLGWVRGQGSGGEQGLMRIWIRTSPTVWLFDPSSGCRIHRCLDPIWYPLDIQFHVHRDTLCRFPGIPRENTRSNALLWNIFCNISKSGPESQLSRSVLSVSMTAKQDWHHCWLPPNLANVSKPIHARPENTAGRFYDSGRVQWQHRHNRGDYQCTGVNGQDYQHHTLGYHYHS